MKAIFSILFCVIVVSNCRGQTVAGLDCTMLKPILSDTAVTNWLSLEREGKKCVVLFDLDHVLAGCDSVAAMNKTYPISRSEDRYKNDTGCTRLTVYLRKRKHRSALELFIDNNGIYVKATFKKTESGYVFSKAALGFVDGPVGDALHHH